MEPKKAKIDIHRPDTSGLPQVGFIDYLGSRATAQIVFPYGLSANPPSGAEGVLTAIEDDRSQLMFQPIGGKDRVPGLLPGEVVVGSPVTGAQLAFDATGRIALGNSAGELFDIFDQLLGGLQSATVATAIGPQPLDPATQLLLTQLRALVALMKGSLK